MSDTPLFPTAPKITAIRPRLIAIYAFLIVANIAAWASAFICFHDRPVLIGTALVAYIFGLRHAFDTDHIAAIDNVVRKLMQEGKKPIAVGFFFSLGHSTIVAIASALIAASAAALDGRSVAYLFGELDQVVLAYATTIHKSQGFGYPVVVIPMLTQHYAMLQRNLLYTGVTRGRRLFVLVGQKKVVAIAVKNASGRRRWTKLREWLAIKGKGQASNGRRDATLCGP